MEIRDCLVSLFVFTFLLGVSCVSSGFAVFGQDPTVVFVESGFESDNMSIQEAINAAEPGDTIVIEAGLYLENVVVNKSVLLLGEGRQSTIIDGGGKGHVVSVEASNVVVSGFTLRDSGISIENPYCGVRLYYSHDSLICNNTIVDNEYGVWLSYSDNNTICDNVVMSSDVYGIRLYQSRNNTLVHNYVVDNQYGIYLYASSEANVVRYNNLSRNAFGLYFGLSDGNLAEGNTVGNSSLYGITLRRSGGNFIFHNNFVGNRLQVDVFDALANVWDEGYPSGGNYWSDYDGVDELYGAGQNMSGSDGLGDTAYGYDVNNQDRFPLMGFFQRFNVLWNGSAYSVFTVCGSTITGFSLAFPETSVELKLNISGAEGTVGLCRISVPKVFHENLENGEYVVVINGNSSLPSREIESESEYDILYLTFVHGPFIPEFTSAFLIPLFLFVIFVVLLSKLAADKKRVRYKAMG